MGMVKRGDIFLANLKPVVGSEQGGIRPILIIQNNISNRNSSVIIAAAITSRVFEKEFSTNVFVLKQDSKLDKDSTVLLNQLRTIDKVRLIRKISSLNQDIMKKVDLALRVSLDLF